MFYLLKIFIKDLIILIPLIISFVVQCFVWIYIFLNIGSDRDQLFLHYNIIFGVDLVGSWWKILALPFGGLLIILINFTLSFFSYSNSKIIARMLTIFTAIFQIFLAWAVILVIYINS